MGSLLILQGSDHSSGRQADIDFNGQYFSIGLINRIESSKGPALMQRVIHKIECPYRVGFRWRNQWYFGHLRDPLFGSSG